MDLKVNAVNFTGKKEVLYALSKAAEKAKNYEYYTQPALAARMTSDRMLTANEASAQAYLDMALNDEAFITSVKNLKASELYKLHNILKPEQTQHSLVEPMNSFQQFMQDVLDNLNKDSISDAVSDLYKKLGL